MAIVTRSIALAAALFTGLAVAADDGAEETEGWSGQGEFGLVVTTGNSETETLNAKLNLQNETGPWVHKLGLTALSASEGDERTAERYELTGKAEYHVTDYSYYFGALRLEDDRFSGFDFQDTIAGGYGRELFETESQALTAEIGAGIRRSQPVGGATETEAIARGALAYQWQISETTSFENNLLVESGADNTYLENATSLRLAINSRFAVKLGFSVRNNTDVPADTEETDTVSTVNLVYDFK